MKCYTLLVCTFGWLVSITFTSIQNEPRNGQSKPSEFKWGSVVQGFQLSMRSPKSEYSPEDDMSFDLVLKNVDSKVRNTWQAASLAVFDFHIVGPDGNAIPMNRRGRQAKESADEGSRATLRLKPKQELRSTINLGLYFDLKNPGTYRITSSRTVGNRSDETKYSTLTSNQLKITIIPPKEKKVK